MKWRLAPQERSGGTYQVAQKGRAKERIGLTLGYVSAEDAERALARLQQEEDGGTIGRVLRLYDREPADAVRYLIGDPEADKLVGPPEPDYGSMTLQEYYDAVYAEARAAHRPKSWPSEQRHWAILLASIGHVKLRHLDEFVLADHLDRLVVTRGSRAGKDAAGNTKRLQRTAIQAMFKHAYRKKHITKLPAFSVFRIDGATKPVRKKPEALDLMELLALLDAASDIRVRALFAVAAAQGLRPSEVVVLKWEHVAWSVPSLELYDTKTEELAETIPLTPLAHRELKAWWEAAGRPTSGTIFPNEDGVPYASGNGYRKALETAVRNAGLDRHVYPYLLRDSFATIAWSLGIPMDVARRVLRHTDEKMIQRVYCRPRPAELVKAVAAFDFPRVVAAEPA